MIKDSGNRTKFESGAVRDIQEGKGRCDLLPLSVIGYWLVDPIFEMIELYRNEKDPYQMSHILNKFAEYHEAVHGPQFSEENRFNYRYSLVLEVAKHFEEGAKKYGDRNWEKGIPCDRYIDSAVRHYCKWRAGWDDEPHDRAFIWNVVCCEWTRQQYGWNLERLGEKDDPNQSMQEFLDKMGNGDFKIEGGRRNGKVSLPRLNRYFTRPQLMSGSLASIASSFNNKKRFTRSACLYLYDRYGQPAGCVWILNAYKSANLYAAIGNVWKRSDDVTLKILEAELSKYEWKPGVDFVVESFDKEDSESKTFAKIGEQMSQALNDCVNMVDNPYVKGMDDGWKFYSVDGRLLGYIFKFEEPSEQKRRQLDIMVKKVWHEVTDNVFTIKRIIEERGYTCDKDFSICVAPSEIAKEYDFKNRKYNEED